MLADKIADILSDLEEVNKEDDYQRFKFCNHNVV